jgi:hypothetical protein
MFSIDMQKVNRFYTGLVVVEQHLAPMLHFESKDYRLVAQYRLRCEELGYERSGSHYGDTLTGPNGLQVRCCPRYYGGYVDLGIIDCFNCADERCPFANQVTW